MSNTHTHTHTYRKKKTGQNKLFISYKGQKTVAYRLHIDNTEGVACGKQEFMFVVSLSRERGLLRTRDHSHKPHDPLTLRTMIPSHRKCVLQHTYTHKIFIYKLQF